MAAKWRSRFFLSFFQKSRVSLCLLTRRKTRLFAAASGRIAFISHQNKKKRENHFLKMLRNCARVLIARKLSHLSCRRISTTKFLLGSNWTAADQKRLDEEIQAELAKIDGSLKNSLSKADYNTMVTEIKRMVSANFHANQGTSLILYLFSVTFFFIVLYSINFFYS